MLGGNLAMDWHPIQGGVEILLVNSSFGDLGYDRSGGSRGVVRGARASPLFWAKKKEMTEGRKAGRTSKIKPGPRLSSKSGSANGSSGTYESPCPTQT